MKLTVTDHAVLRYLERHGGFEIEALRRNMEARLRPYAMSGADRVRLDGMVFVFRDGHDGRAVATVLSADASRPRLEGEHGDG